MKNIKKPKSAVGDKVQRDKYIDCPKCKGRGALHGKVCLDCGGGGGVISCTICNDNKKSTKTDIRSEYKFDHSKAKPNRFAAKAKAPKVKLQKCIATIDKHGRILDRQDEGMLIYEVDDKDDDYNCVIIDRHDLQTVNNIAKVKVTILNTILDSERTQRSEVGRLESVLIGLAKDFGKKNNFKSVKEAVLFVREVAKMALKPQRPRRASKSV